MIFIIPKFLNYLIQQSLLCIVSSCISIAFKICPIYRRILKGEFSKADVLFFHRFKQTLLRRPWDIQVNDNRAYGSIASYVSLGMGDSYVKGWWESPNLQETLFRIVKGNMDANPLQRWHHNVCLEKYQLFNYHSKSIALDVGKKLYDKHGAVFKIMLDPSMSYSSAYWARGARNLAEAQKHKMELIAGKLKLEPGMKVLDLGCGYGGLMKYLAQTHKVTVVGCTVSNEEASAGRTACAELKLENIEIALADYREFLKKKAKDGETFDRVVCINMLEHVGHSNYREFFKLIHKVLKDGGLLLVETVGQNEAVMPLVDPWTTRNIARNFVFPYHTMLPKYSDGLFVLEDWTNIGIHLYKTMNAWIDNFHLEFHTISGKYEKAEEFHRKWSYFLQTAASGLRARKLQCWQVVFSKGGCEGGYDFNR